MRVALRDVSKRFGETPVLSNLSFDVASGELLSLVGPSGVGKTTLLRIIAGIEKPSGGRCEFERTPSVREPVILVFQDYLLFPHMRIRDNVAFGLKQRRWITKRERESRVAEALRFFELQDCADRYPGQISGGQKQRVALARAMVLKPAVLLLDEPFAHLDRNLKLSTAAYIRDTQREFGTTTIAVTHDLAEAFAMSDRIGVMLGGQLRRLDKVEAIYSRPGGLEEAQFLGPVNELAPEDAVHFTLPCECDRQRAILFRAEQVELSHPAGEAQGALDRGTLNAGTVSAVQFFGTTVAYEVETAAGAIKVLDLRRRFSVGERVSVRIVDYFQ